MSQRKEAMRKAHALDRLNQQVGLFINKEDKARSHDIKEELIKEELMTRGVEC
jgi:hypothetical protein